MNAIDRMATEYARRLDEALMDAALDGYDYVYVVNDYNIRHLPNFKVEQPTRVGDAFTPKRRIVKTNIEPDKIKTSLDMHGHVTVYEL